jgi:hypothetical protein
MKYTLLQMTQDILSNMSSDEVNSISDTAESLQVATIIKQKYYDIISRGDLPEHNQLFQLNSSLDETKPTIMTVPDGIGRIEYIKYYDTNPLDSTSISIDTHGLNVDIQPTILTFTSTTSNTIGLGSKTWTVSAGLGVSINMSLTVSSGLNSMTGLVTGYAGTSITLNVTSVIGSGTFTNWSFTTTIVPSPPGYKYVVMLPIEDFLHEINKLNLSDTNVQSYTFSDTSNEFPNSFTFLYRNDIQPQYCCILSNFYVIFDSFDNTQDSTLQTSKSMCFGQVVPTFQLVDTFIPDLDSQQFPLLLNEAKNLAYYELKQQPHQLAIQEVKRQWSTVQKNKSINNRPTYFDELPNFGRKTGRYYGTRKFDEPRWL